MIEFGTTFSVPIQIRTSFDVTDLTVIQNLTWGGTPPYLMQTNPS